MTSKKKKKNFESACRVYEEVRDFSKKTKKDDDDVAKAYITRCAFNALNIYKDLSSNVQKECKAEYLELKEDILTNGSFDDKALKMRCYGTAVWAGYKVHEKSIGCLCSRNGK